MRDDRDETKPPEGPLVTSGTSALDSADDARGESVTSDDPCPEGQPGGLVPVPVWDRRKDRRALALLLLIVWLVYLVTATYDAFQLNDNRAVNLSAWSLGTRGTFELPAEWEGGNRWISEGRDGALYTNRFPGAILWTAPFHAVAEPLFGIGTPGHDVLLNYAPGGVAAATVTALAVAITFLVFRRLAPRRTAVTAAAFLAFGTGVWSVSADSMWTHGLTHLMLMLGVLAAADARFARSGLAFAGSVLTRPHTAVVPAVMGLWESISRRSWRPVIVVGATSALGVLALAVYSQWLFGTWIPVAGYDPTRPAGVVETSWTVTLERFANTLAHHQRGVMIYTPALLVLLPFTRHGWRVAPAWVRSATVGGVLYLAVQLRVNEWTGGADFFGSRLTLETLVLLSPLLLLTWRTCIVQSERLKGACVGLLVVGMLVHGYGALNPITAESRAEWRAELDGLCEREPDMNGC